MSPLVRSLSRSSLSPSIMFQTKFRSLVLTGTRQPYTDILCANRPSVDSDSLVNLHEELRRKKQRNAPKAVHVVPEMNARIE